MVSQMNVLFLVAALALLAGCGAYQQTLDTPIAVEGKSEVAKSREDVKSLVDTTTPWLEVTFNDMEYMFCAKDLPAYGSSRIELHGWVFRKHSKQWERVFLVRTNGVGRLGLSVDSKNGVFSARGTANNKFKDKKVFDFDLDATEA